MLSHKGSKLLSLIHSKLFPLTANLSNRIGKEPFKIDEIEDKPNFPGSRSKWTSKLSFIDSESYEGIPVFRVMNRDGKIVESNLDPNLGQEMMTNLYKGENCGRK